MPNALNCEYNFILYRDTLVLGAISNDILRRTMGVSKYRKTRLFLVECSKEFSDHARNYTATYDLEILVVQFLQEVKVILLKKGINNQIIVTHTWPNTLFSVVPVFRDQNLLLIEVGLPLFDRLPSGIRDRDYRDRILSTKPAIRMVTFRYRRAVKAAKMYVSISDYEKNVQDKYYDLQSDEVVYCPVDERYFLYAESERKSLMVFGKPNENAIRCIMNSVGHDRIREIILINSRLSLSGGFASDVKITDIRNYTFQEIRDVYKRALLSVTDESRGAFELMPIESIMSGVPIISPVVPSLKILKDSLDSSHPQKEKKVYPFFGYINLVGGCKNDNISKELASWYSEVEYQREFFSVMCNKLFSIDAVARDFIAKVDQHFSYVSEK